jgi:hypothetical protein
MATEWRVQQFEDANNAAGWTVGPFGSASQGVICNWNEGETVLRARIQGTFQGSVNTISPSTDQIGEYVLGGTEIIFGVWADPDVPTGTLPPSPDSLTLDPGFMLVDQLEMTFFQYYPSMVGAIENVTAVFRLPSGGGNSFSKRGPATQTHELWFAWHFFNPFGLWWTTEGPPDEGFYSYTWRVAVLIDHV